MHVLSLLTLVKLAHLMGLIMGLGGAFLADYTIFTRGVIRPVSAYTIHQAEFLSRLVSIGLVILWVTGSALIWLNLQQHPEYLTNPKLWAKIAIVVLLTVNGVCVHRIILPIMRRSVGYRLFAEMPSRSIAMLTLFGSVSVVSWSVPFILGKASELNYITPMWQILAVYLVVVLTVWGMMFAVMRSISRIQQALQAVAAKTVMPNEAWEGTDWSGRLARAA
jgi:hypothetical protein